MFILQGRTNEAEGTRSLNVRIENKTAYWKSGLGSTDFWDLTKQRRRNSYKHLLEMV